MRKPRLRLFDFFVNRWLLKALYLRIFPVPVTLNVFFARECVFIFGMVFKIWDGKGSEKLKIKTKKVKHIFNLILLDLNNTQYVFYNIICTFTLQTL